MTRIISHTVATVLLAMLMACAGPRSVQTQSRLDDLFSRLRTTASTEEAASIELDILHVWADSGRADVDSLMMRGTEQAHAGDMDGALVTFNQVVVLAPDFAEGYDQRALVHVMRDEYPEAIVDIQRVLAIEPRHFGALAGLGRIFLMYDQDGAALSAFEAALAVNPHLDAVRDQVKSLREKLSGLPV